MQHVQSIQQCRELWPFIKHAFDCDGGLRDIYVLGTDASKWTQVLKALEASSVGAEYFVGEERQAQIPSQWITTISVETPQRMTLHIAGMRINTFFYTEEWIEFDVDPTEVQEDNFGDLCNFMMTLSAATETSCILTDENWVLAQTELRNFMSVDARSREVSVL
jgi:hypothetical protein